MNPATAYVTHFNGASPADLTLKGSVPIPGNRDFEHRVLARKCKWEQARCGACGGIGAPVDYGLLRLERRIAAESRVPIDSRTVCKHANTGPECRLGIRCISESQARLEDEVMRLCETLRQAMIEPIELPCMQNRESVTFFARDFTTGQHDSVVLIATYYESARPVHDRSFRAIVKLWKELGQTPPAAVPRRPNGVPHTVLNRKLAGCLPAILCKPVERGCHPGCD